MPLGMAVDLISGDFVFDGDPTPSQKGAEPPIFGPCLLRQTAGWIKMPLGTEVGLGPGDIVLDGDPAPLPAKGTDPPPQFFGPCPLWLNGWMDQDGTWHGGGPWCTPHCARWRPSSPPQKGGSAAPNFRPIFIVAKRLDASRCHLVWR